MKGRDLAITLGVLYDKRALIRGDATSHSVSISTDTKLKTLEDKFKEFASQLEEKRVNSIPGDVDNAVD